MQTATLLQIFNSVQHSLHLTKTSAIGSDTEAQQILDAINRAADHMFQLGSFYWNEYMGTLITVAGKRTYELTPAGANYCPMSRDFSSASLVDITLAPKNQVSWDDSYSASRLTTTGAAPSVTITSVGTIQSNRVSASIWLQGDTEHPPSTSTDNPYQVSLTLTDLAGNQSTTQTINISSQMDRYAISAYFTAASTGVKFKISWSNPAGVLWADAAQIEVSDFATEYIDNPGVTTLERTVFVSPDRLVGAGKYTPGRVPVYTDIFTYDAGLYPYERAQRLYTTSQPNVSNQGGMLNLENVPANSHIIYRGKQVPKKLVAAADTVLLPKPWYWVLVQGAKAHMESAIYDIGSNTDATESINRFEKQVKTTLEMSDPSPAYLIIHNNYARMVAVT